MADVSRVRAAVQAMLRVAGADIRIDGIWGLRSQQAYDEADKATSARVASYLSSVSVSEAELTGGLMETISDVEGIKSEIVRIARLEGVPVQLALKVAKLESKFKPTAVSPSGYKGLFQLGDAAITDVRSTNPDGINFVPTGRKTAASVPLYTLEKPFDITQNATVGIRYIKLIAQRMRVSLDDYVKVYMAYNIGVGGALAVLSGRPESVAQLIAANPAYGKGVPQQYYPALQKAVQMA